MRSNPVLASCFRTSPVSHMSGDSAPPKSPSSIVLLDEHDQESKNMFAVTQNWFLDNDFLLPTKPHLRDYCRRVATLLQGDRVVCFVCTSPESVGSCSVSVHLSRIQTHGGRLLRLVLPNVSTSSTKLFKVQVQESALGMLAISDYLYRSHIEFASLDVSDTIEIASAANRWECHDLFIGSILHMVYKHRLDEPFTLRTTVSFRWLPQAPLIFVQYLCDRAGIVLPMLNFPQLIEVLHSACVTSTTRLRDHVLKFIADNGLVRTVFHVKLLLAVYHEYSIPSMFKEYFAVVMARFFFLLWPERSVSDELLSDEEYDRSTELEDMKPTSCCGNITGVINKRCFIKLLHRNMILLKTLSRINESTSKEYDAKNLFWTILHYVEPLIHQKGTIVTLLQGICVNVIDRERLLADESTWNHLSAEGMRIVALSLCNRRSYSPALQLSVHISWDSLRSGSPVNNATGSVAGVKFELKARSTSKRVCSWRLYYSNVEGCSEPRMVSYARVSHQLVSSNCCCDDRTRMERMTKVRLKDRRPSNGSIRDLHTEGELTVVNEKEAEDWCSRHQKSCTLSIFVRVEF